MMVEFSLDIFCKYTHSTVRTTVVQDSRSSKCMNGTKRGENCVAKKTKNKDGTIFNTVHTK